MNGADWDCDITFVQRCIGHWLAKFPHLSCNEIFWCQMKSLVYESPFLELKNSPIEYPKLAGGYAKCKESFRTWGIPCGCQDYLSTSVRNFYDLVFLSMRCFMFLLMHCHFCSFSVIFESYLAVTVSSTMHCKVIQNSLCAPYISCNGSETNC